MFLRLTQPPLQRGIAGDRSLTTDCTDAGSGSCQMRNCLVEHGYRAPRTRAGKLWLQRELQAIRLPLQGLLE